MFFYIMLLFPLLTSSFTVVPNEYQYRQAKAEDVSAILQLVDTSNTEDDLNIVKLPIKFRQLALHANITHNRTFIATNASNVVGIKKLFLFDKHSDEFNELLQDELRMIGQKSHVTFNGHLTSQNSKITIAECADNVIIKHNYNNGLYIYNGADFTHQAHRGNGINSQLTNYALMHNQEAIQNALSNKPYDFIAMVYGLSKYNAGSQPGASGDRTPSIAATFIGFLQKTFGTIDMNRMIHARYAAVKPTFDPNAQICAPLPDEQGVPGYGCVLLYSLKDS